MVALGKHHWDTMRRHREMRPDEAWYEDCQFRASRCPENTPVWFFAAKEIGAINSVYFIRMGKTTAIKIGCAEVVAKRLSDLQIGSPVELTVAGFVSFWKRKWMRRAESAAFKIADELGARHLRGEWYDMELEFAESVWKTLIDRSAEQVMGAAWMGGRGGKPK